MRSRDRGAALLAAMLTVALVATFASAALWQQWRSVEVEAAERARVQSAWVLAAGYHPRHSPLGIGWTAITAAAMFALAAGKARTGAALGNPVLATEGRVTLIDGILATAVLAGLLLNAAAGWWQADPAAGFVLVYYASREAWQIFRAPH